MEHVIQNLRELQSLGKMIGESAVFKDAIKQLPAMAKGETTVVISGETGTGKELVARAIHYLSKRAPCPFIPVNCGSLPDTLLEDELFGHERGAFTDAHSRRVGLLAQAEKGTIFLDEVDTLTARAQVTLLRVLQDKSFRAIGASREQVADVRFVAATNALLEELVKMGLFRADLYYRLNIFRLHLPPLRDRKEDIPLLVQHLLQKHTPSDQPVSQLSVSAQAALQNYDWPGNVRELENAIIRGIHLNQNGVIEAGDLGLEIEFLPLPLSTQTGEAELLPFKRKKQEILEAFERDYLTRLMQLHQGNISQAARAAGKERRDLGKLLKKYHLNPRFFCSSAPPASS